MAGRFGDFMPECVMQGNNPRSYWLGWLPQKHPAHGVKLRWQNKICQDLKKCSVDESCRYKKLKIVPDGDLFIMKDLHIMVPFFEIYHLP